MILHQVRDNRADAEAVHTVTTAAFPDEEWSERRTARFLRRVRHLATTDPAGCWLAEDDAGTPVGAVLASLRESLWGLSLLVVAPGAQGKGVGTELMRRALAYSRGTLRGMICARPHAAAARVYRGAGFGLHPTMRMTGTVDATRLSVPDGPAIEGGPAHRDLMDSVDRRLRGSAHGPDHEELLRHCRVVVADDLGGSGYCYLADDGRVELLAATSRRIAVRLLTSALLGLPAGATATLRHLTAEQEWALDVGFAAGLDLAPDGWLCLRGMRPPRPYLPSVQYL
ncbi:GNAT family N-acetyltransferase [Streptomyces litchfieldiae]|uniref:GNAT family N-acetyltransferase n=1 Tax=Streptomyces litchfieldiae TaxID=3075543 RepID=A0ABU2MT11_9ACTN|nr:GNAT family N-acetyltransferase [Streptomyces sp. DSM 44938]MDT0344665.1 GNAT family N-acetyltransferase [Streptomyces sp. DSM 44938]